MQVAETEPVEIRRFIAAQRHERYRAFVVHGKPLSGKTSFARRLAEVESGAYVDLLQYVAGHPELAQMLDTFDAVALGELVVRQAKATGVPLLLIDEMDFLVHTWGGDLRPFQQLVTTLSVMQTTAVIGFLLQTTPTLQEWRLRSAVGHHRILALEAIRPL